MRGDVGDALAGEDRHDDGCGANEGRRRNGAGLERLRLYGENDGVARRRGAIQRIAALGA